MNTIIESIDLPEICVPELPASPYPGLRPFLKSEWPIFFGRERMTDEVTQRLMRDRLVVVHGASGNGKSSLVRAGVQARLEQQHARFGLRWQTGAMRPGNSPLANLAAALVDAVADRPGLQSIDLRRALNCGRQAADAVARLLTLGPTDRLCILLDQFEELFRFSDESNRDQSTLLTDFLVGFAEKPPDGLYVLVTMRSEFLGECPRFAGLADTINRTQYLLPRMDTDDLLRAVREPAALYGGSVTERLAERLVTDALGGQDELPLIQHGLSRLWQSSSPPLNAGVGPILDLPDYLARGPLGRLLSEHADSIADAVAGSPAGQKIVQELFRALTDINAAGNAVRHPRTFDQLVAVTGTTADGLRPILDAFRQPGVSFVTPYPPDPIEGGTTIDVSHEALIRRWQRIADPREGWLQQEFRDGLIWLTLVVQADSFAADPESLLTEAATEARSAWIRTRSEAWALRYGGHWSAVQELMAASRREVDRQRQRAEEDRQREERLRFKSELAKRRWRQMVAAAVAAVLMLVLALAAGYQSWQASNAWHRAELAKATAETALASAQMTNRELQDALKSAASAQDASTSLFLEALSLRGSNAQRLEVLLNALRSTTDPYQIAVLGQSVAALSNAATIQQLSDTTRILVATLGRTRNQFVANAIEQALTTVGKTLPPERAMAVLSPLLSALLETREPDKLRALAAAVRAIGPRLQLEQATAVGPTLVQVLGRTNDPSALSAIAEALTSLGGDFKLSGAQAQRALEPLLAALAATRDVDQLEALAQPVRRIVSDLEGRQLNEAMNSLFTLLREAPDPSAASAINMALPLSLIDPGWKPTTEQAQAVVGPVIAAIRVTTDPRRLEALADTAKAIAPMLGRGRAQLGDLTQALLEALLRSADHLAALGPIARTLTDLDWRPTGEQADRAIGPLLRAIRVTDRNDAELLETLIGVLQRIVPSLSPKMARSSEVLATLVGVLREAPTSAVASAVARVLTGVAAGLNPEEARLAVAQLIDNIAAAGDPDELTALAEAARAVVPRLEPSAARDALSRLRSIKDPVASKIIAPVIIALDARAKGSR